LQKTEDVRADVGLIEKGGVQSVVEENCDGAGILAIEIKAIGKDVGRERLMRSDGRWLFH